MKKTEISSLKKIYTEKKEELIKTIDNSQFEIDTDGDEVDQIQGKSLILVQNQISKSNLRKLNLLETALKHIDNKDFGQCEECGEDIGFKRLAAIPGVTLCIGCAEQAERNK